MVNILKIIVLGGDERQKYLTENLKAKGYNTEHIFTKENLKEKINSSDYVVLPLPSTKDKITVFNTLSDDKIYISDLQEYIKNQKVFTCKLMLEGKNCRDYSILDSFAIKNAVPTAEGAIALAVLHSKKTLFSNKALIIGNGRIGKILSIMLKNMGADVTVSARKESDLSFIEAFNMKNIRTSDINSVASQFDFVFNTVDFPVIDTEFLRGMKKDALLIELASHPGGIYGDKAAAKCEIINAQGLPGKYSPITAAEILTDTVISLIDAQKGEIL